MTTGYSQPESRPASPSCRSSIPEEHGGLQPDRGGSEGRQGRIVGYWLGGTISWMAAAAPAASPARAYYGRRHARPDRRETKIPTIVHFGELTSRPTPRRAKESPPGIRRSRALVTPAPPGLQRDQRGSWNAEAAKLARKPDR